MYRRRVGKILGEFVMAERLEDWRNQTPDDKNKEELSIKLEEILDKLLDLEERLEILEGA